CRGALGVSPMFVGPSRAGIRFPGYPARSVGVDRLLSAAAAFERYGRAVVVVDMGSAMTFDAVDSGGRFLGGAIAPGPGMMAASLGAMTARLPRVAPQRPRRATGRDTRSCILSGVVLGAAGAVDRVVSEISREMRGRPVVVATGGFAGLIAPLSRTISRVHPNLVLEGLFLAWERNRRRIDNAAG
nr:type III pantothenate kinase [bacterium]